jgi:hypothetical protein
MVAPEAASWNVAPALVVAGSGERGYFDRRERTGRSSKTLASTPSTLASFSTIVMLAL